jgi:hypothetical protein
MTTDRKLELHGLVIACHHTDNTELEAEKTAVLEELLKEVERLENNNAGGWRGLAQVLMDVERSRENL